MQDEIQMHTLTMAYISSKKMSPQIKYLKDKRIYCWTLVIFAAEIAS